MIKHRLCTGGSGVQLHANPGHVREAVPAAQLRVRPPGRLHVHQEAGQGGGPVQRSHQRTLHFHAVLQGGWLRPQPHRRKQVRSKS